VKYCTNCGEKLNEEDAFCPSCGTSVHADESAPKKRRPLFSSDDLTADFDADDVAKHKTMAVLSYFSILVLIPLFAAPNSPYVKFHASQGLWLFLFTLAGWVIPRGGCLVYIAVAILSIFGIVAAAKSRARTLPVIGRLPKLV